MIQSRHVSMGFLRSLYYEQVQKSIADAKRERARKVEQQDKEEREKARDLRRRLSDRRNRHIRPVETNINKRPIPQQQRTPNFTQDDLIDAFEEME